MLVLGGSGEMGSAAVADLLARTDHEITIGAIRVDAARALLRLLGALTASPPSMSRIRHPLRRPLRGPMPR